MSAPAVAAAAGSAQNLVAVHFWHGVEALGFLLITVGGIVFVEWRQRRRTRPVPTGCDHTPSRLAQRLRPGRAAPDRIGPDAATRLLSTAALACTAAAGVHYVVMPEHFEESAIYGTFFLVTATAQVGYSVWLLLKPSRALLGVGLLANIAVVGLWLMTRLVAIPLGPAAGTREAFGGLDVLASGFELAFIVAAAVLMIARTEPPQPTRIRRMLLHPSAAGLVLVTAVVIGFVAHIAPPS